MNVYEFIEKHEERRSRPYRCPAGKLTIGVGWNLDARQMPRKYQVYLKEHGEITNKMIDALLEMSVAG